MIYKKLISYMLLISYAGSVIPAQFERESMSIVSAGTEINSQERKHSLEDQSEGLGYVSDDEDLKQVVAQGEVAVERRKNKRHKSRGQRDVDFQKKSEAWSFERKKSIERHRSHVSESEEEGEGAVRFYSKVGHEVFTGYQHQLLSLRQLLITKGIVGPEVQEMVQSEEDWEESISIVNPQQAYVAAVHLSQACHKITTLCESPDPREKEQGDVQKNSMIARIKHFNQQCTQVSVLEPIVRNLICRTDGQVEKVETARELEKLEEVKDEDFDNIIWKGYERLLAKLDSEISQLENKEYSVGEKSIGKPVEAFRRLKESYRVGSKNREEWMYDFEQFKADVSACPVFDFIRSTIVLSSMEKNQKKGDL